MVTKLDLKIFQQDLIIYFIHVQCRFCNKRIYKTNNTDWTVYKCTQDYFL